MSLGDRNDIDHFVLLEDIADVDWLFKQALCKVDLLVDGSAVDLDLHEMRLLLLQRRLADLRVCEDTHDGAVLLDAVELSGDGFGTGGVLLGVFGEGLLLGLVPVLVEAAFDLVAEMFGPDGSQRAEATGGFDVADNTDNDHLWGLVWCAVGGGDNVLGGSR